MSVHVADVGTEIIVAIKEDGAPLNISTASVKQIKIKPPNNGTLLTKTALFTTDGSDGSLSYITLITDLAVAGRYQIQAYVEMGAWKGHTNKVYMDVEENLA